MAIQFLNTTSTVPEIQINDPSNLPQLTFKESGLVSGGISTTSGNLIFKASSGIERMRIDSSGNVGIGTTSPTTPLQVNGIVRIDTSGNTAFYEGDGVRLFGSQNYRFRNTSGNVRAIINVTSGNLSLYNASNNVTNLIATAGDSYFNGGNVGIGTTTPATTLEVKTGTSAGTVRLSSDGNGAIFSANGDLQFYTNNTAYATKFYSANKASTLATILDSGKVLVGVTGNQTQSKLTSRQNGSAIEFGHLNQSGQYYGTLGAMSSSGSPFIAFSADNSTSNSFTTRGAKGFVISQDTGLSGDLIFSSVPLVNTANQSLVEKMRITSGGAIKFNTYGAGTLVSDASGNITVSSGGGAGGPYLPLAGGTMTAGGTTFFPDNTYLNVGTSGDAVFYHDGTNTIIRNYTGNLYIDNNSDDKSIIFRNDDGAGGVETYFQLEGASGGASPFTVFPDSSTLAFGSGHDMRLYHNNGGFIDNYTGVLQFTNYADDSDIVFRSDNGSGGVENYIQIDGSEGRTLFNKNIRVNDNVEIQVGSSADLKIYHDGTDSFISDTGTGDLKIASSTILMLKPGFGEFLAKFIPDGAVELYYDAVKKFETTSAGVSVTGQLTVTNGIEMTAGNFNAGDNERIRLGNSADFQIYHSGTHSFIDGSNGEGSLYIRPGSGGTIQLETTSGADMIVGAASAVTLYSSGNSKLSTGAVGVGTATTTGGTLIDGWITTTQANAIDNTTVATTAYVNNKIALIPAGLVFQGTWNAATNTPTLASGTGTTGNFYIVSVAGSTNLDGITDWKVGDWAVFIEQGASDQWEKIDNSSVLDGFGTGNQIAKWSGSGTSNTLTDSILEDNGSELVSAGKIILNNVAGDRKIQFNRTGGNSYSIEQDSASLYFYNTSTSETPLLFQNDGDVIMTAGNVGIGTTSPTSRLHVEGAATAGTYAAYIHNASGGGNVLKLYNHDWDTSDFLLYATNGGTAGNGYGFTVDGNARVNIGLATVATANAAADDLHLRSLGSNGITISSGNTQTGTIFFGDVANAAVAGFRYNHNTGDMAISAEDNITFACDNVGIGLTNPLNKLVVSGIDTNAELDGATVTQAALQLSNSDEAYGTFFGTQSSGTGLIQQRRQSQATYYNLGINPYGGNVGIGTTSPAKKLTVATDTVNDGVYITTSGGTNVARIGTSSTATSGALALLAGGSTKVFISAKANENSYFNGGGNVGIGTTSPDAKLEVSGGIIAGGKTTYSYSAGSLNTTGTNVAGLTTGSNGSSAGFIFTCFGGGGYQKIVYSCNNVSGTWNVDEDIDEGVNAFEVIASTPSGSGVTFTWRARTSTQSYTPRVTVEAFGQNINQTYIT